MFDLPAISTLQPEQAISVVLTLPNIPMGEGSEHSAFANGMLEYVAIGQITYLDGFSKGRRHTNFRVYVAKSTEVRFANVGNDAN